MRRPIWRIFVLGFSRYIHSPLYKHEKLGSRANKCAFINYLECLKGFVIFGKNPDRGMTDIKPKDVDFLCNEHYKLEEASEHFMCSPCNECV